MAPPEKKRKTEEEEEAAAKEGRVENGKDVEMRQAGNPEEEAAALEEKEAPEPPKELETDAVACAKPKGKGPITFLTQDTMLNVMQSTGTNVLMSLTEGGIQHFIAGARANVGVNKGRYMFEVKIVQLVGTAEASMQGNSRIVGQRMVVRVGFSTAGSELILGEGEENICFESEGNSVHSKARTGGVEKFGRDNIVGVLLNLDKDSPNYNTVSLFKDGVRASQPVPLPEGMKGQPPFPHVSYKGASLHVNFGPNHLKTLPFKCRMVQDAAVVDVKETKLVEPAGGKYDVILPVSMPDEGTFDWLDMFLEKNKLYVELSDRKILEWAEKSGIWKPKGYGARGGNDKPDMNFHVRELDDCSMRRALYMIAPLQKRHYVVMEVRANLIKDERKEAVARFSASHFKKVACVMVGEPNLEFRKRSQHLMLASKQEAANKAFELKKLEEQRKKQIEKRQKEMLKAQKLKEREKKKAVLEAKKKAAEEEKAKKEAEEKAKKAAGANGEEE